MAVVYIRTKDNSLRDRINNAILDERRNIKYAHAITDTAIDADHVTRNLDLIARAINHNVLVVLHVTSLLLNRKADE